jgi:2-dehydro-3-deoxyphosphogluconate aldolase/(4S)-4-hydroxy-2-oxoglutarate aldolase
MTEIQNVSELLDGQTVVPVVVIDNQNQALGLANALMAGGVNVIEITLRNAYGLTAISEIKNQFPDMLVLAGTVNSVDALQQVADAGVDGVISPGLTDSLLQKAQDLALPYLPGVCTASEILKAIEFGLQECKLFPASIAGGIPALKAFSGPFPSMRFCPTGGISEANYRDFLALGNVMCVGGSWLAPTSAIENEDWSTITSLCSAITKG